MGSNWLLKFVYSTSPKLLVSTYAVDKGFYDTSLKSFYEMGGGL